MKDTERVAITDAHTVAVGSACSHHTIQLILCSQGAKSAVQNYV